MSLLSLPHELLSQIESLLGCSDLSRLSRSCTKLHGLFTTVLYHRDAEQGYIGPLAWAATYGSAPTVNRAAKIGLTLPTEQFSQLVFLATSKCYTDCVESLLDMQPFDLNRSYEYGGIVLLLAIFRCSVPLVKLFLGRGADPTVVDKSGNRWSSLHIAARTANDEVIKLLLTAGASPYARSSGDETPLLKAIQRGGIQGADTLRPGKQRRPITDEEIIETVQLFFDSGYQMDAADGSSYLYEACWQGRETLAQFLMSRGVGPRQQTEHVHSCLGVAATNGHVDVVKLLLDQGVDINAASSYGFTPLVEAVGGGNLEVIKLIVETGGADVNLADQHGDTPLNSSVSPAKFSEELPRYLLESNEHLSQSIPPF